jgi:hypothetical protein
LARLLSRRSHPEVAAGEWGSRPIGRWCSPWQASATGLDRYRGTRPGPMDLARPPSPSRSSSAMRQSANWLGSPARIPWRSPAAASHGRGLRDRGDRGACAEVSRRCAREQWAPLRGRTRRSSAPRIPQLSGAPKRKGPVQVVPSTHQLMWYRESRLPPVNPGKFVSHDAGMAQPRCWTSHAWVLDALRTQSYQWLQLLSS